MHNNNSLFKWLTDANCNIFILYAIIFLNNYPSILGTNYIFQVTKKTSQKRLSHDGAPGSKSPGGIQIAC